MSRLRAVFVGVVGIMGGLACNALLGIDNYRACDGGECDGGVLTPDAPVTACQRDDDCVAADAGTVCDQNACTSVAEVARGMSLHECVVLANHTALCWGRNAEAQLGNQLTSSTSVATPVGVLDENGQRMTGIQHMSLGYDFSCAVRLVAGNTSVSCWGLSAAGGNSKTATQVNLGNASVAALTAATEFACALTTSNTNQIALCWGKNDYGQLGCTNGITSCADGGQPAPITKSTQQPLQLGTLFPSIVSAGAHASCLGFASSPFIDCFGADPWGNLGDDGGIDNSCCLESNPQPSLGHTVIDIQSAEDYACGQVDDKSWLCWGANSSYDSCPLLPPCSDRRVPTPLWNAQPILSLSPGWRHMCGIIASGTYCWGQNDHGQVGNAAYVSTPQVNAPVNVDMPVAASDVAAHRHWTCALGMDRRVYCWGQNGDQTDPTPWLLGGAAKPGDVHTPQPVTFE